MVDMRAPLLLVTTGVTLALLASGAPSNAPVASGPITAVSSAAAASISSPAVTAKDDAAMATKVARVNLSVDAKAGRHAISPLIYGVNFAAQTPGLSSAFTVPVDRWGGNSTSRYNYTNDTYNTGQDWYFENIVSGTDKTLTAFIDGDRSHGSASLVTVPMVGWVSKDSPAAHPFLCSFPRTSFANQNDFDHWDDNCGNGTEGSTQLVADPGTTSNSVGAAFDHAMVATLVSRYGTAANGGVKFYELDNEPALWNSTHRDVHPTALTAEELWTRSKATADAVKAADASAGVVGPSDWGWCAYYYSAAEDCGQSPDAASRGNLPLGAWYLQQFAAAQGASGTRLLDYFDEHFYPQANGVALGSAGGSATQALRLRSTRSLWDPAYSDESWISDANGGTSLQWIRTMKNWVADYYPGTKTAITEYNWGGLESMNGALAQADVLGIFGREGLDLATLWGPTKATDPWAYAFRMYRNYDKKFHQFGNTAIKASTGNQGRLAVYAATRSSDGALTVMVINKTHSTIPSTLTVKNFAGKSKANVFRYSSAHLKTIVKLAAVSVRKKLIKTSFPGYSVTLLVLPKR
jgi:hypothetical protein